MSTPVAWKIKPSPVPLRYSAKISNYEFLRRLGQPQ